MSIEKSDLFPNVPGIEYVKDTRPRDRTLEFPLAEPDMINHPPHYADKGAGVECIDIVELFNFNMGNAIKYIWRADDKGDPIENLRKAEWYVRREIERRQRVSTGE